MEKLINDFSFGLFFFQIAAFVVLLLLLKKYAWKPILAAIEQRENGISDAMEAAEKARAEMVSLKSDNEKLMQEAREQRDTLIKEARQIKEKLISDASVEAEEKAKAIIEKAKQAIQAEKQSAMADIKTQMSELSIDIAEKVMKKELSEKEGQMKLVDEMLKEVELN